MSDLRECCSSIIFRSVRKALGMSLKIVAERSGYCERYVRYFEGNPKAVGKRVRLAMVGVYENAGAVVTISGGRLTISVPYEGDQT